MAKFDAESLVYDIESMLKAKLTSVIEAINDEKSDDIEIDPIPEDAFFIQSMDDKVANYNTCCLITLQDITTSGIGPQTSKNYAISIAIISYLVHSKNITRQMFRYGRALETVFHENWDRIGQHRLKISIQSIPPQDYVDLNRSKSFKTVAVVVQGGIA